MKYSRVCNTLEDTKKLAQDFAGLIENGCFVNLYGEIGAGKTAFVKLVAEALGVTEKVTSPSFVILNEYHSAKLPVYHFDLYRLDDPDQLEDTGIFDVLGADGVCSIEWGEQFANEIGDARVDVFVTRLDSEATPGEEPPREVRLVAHVARGEALLAAL